MKSRTQKVLVAAIVLSLFACKAKKGGDTQNGGITATPVGTGTNYNGTTVAGGGANAPPASVPEFLDRFCAAVRSGDKAYVTAHTENGTFSSTRVTDPTKCGGRTGKRCSRSLGGAHADADFGPVCARIQAQPKAALASSVKDEGAILRAHLSDGDLVSDLILDRQGKDFRLLREVAPGTR